jgi:thiol:disulfide interchange protein DsbG
LQLRYALFIFHPDGKLPVKNHLPFALRGLALAACVASALTLAACSPKDTPQKETVASIPADQSLDAVAKEGRGFTVGSMMAANTVYVLFDPQCPHCGHLWQQALPLHNKVKFVWLPVAFINAKSEPQGAALMSATDPVEAMNAHEASILAGAGGMAASSSVAPELASAIKNNTQLLNRLGVASVPHIIAKNQVTGQVVSNTGALDTEALGKFLGIN